MQAKRDGIGLVTLELLGEALLNGLNDCFLGSLILLEMKVEGLGGVLQLGHLII